MSEEKLNELLAYCVDFAEILLKESGEFYPFGAVLNNNLELQATGVHDGNDFPDSLELMKFLSEAFIKSASDGEINASALVCDVNIPNDFDTPVNDGVRVHLESNGFSRFIYIPYQLEKRGFFRKANEVVFFEAIAVEIEPQIFRNEQGA